MRLLNKLFSTSVIQKEENILSWIPLTELSQFHDIEKQSNIKAQILFKYSTRCAISRMVMNQFVEDFNFEDHQVDLYYLDLIRYREVSNGVAHTFNVVHESPQILIIRNGTVVKHASHGSVNDIDLNQFV